MTSAESAQRRALALTHGGSGAAGRHAGAGRDPRPVRARRGRLPARRGPAGRVEDDAATPTRTAAAAAEFTCAGRAAAAATDWALADGPLDVRAADVGTEQRRDDDRRLNAVVALGRYRVREAEQLAAAAVAAAERGGDPDLLCEALLVHGRCVRMHDLAGASAAFARARDAARGGLLAHREARALTELGSVESYRNGDDAVLRAACALAEACGAPETEAVAGRPCPRSLVSG